MMGGKKEPEEMMDSSVNPNQGRDTAWINRDIYHAGNTIVLKKPRKEDYSLAESYRPIALLSRMTPYGGLMRILLGD